MQQTNLSGEVGLLQQGHGRMLVVPAQKGGDAGVGDLGPAGEEGVGVRPVRTFAWIGGNGEWEGGREGGGWGTRGPGELEGRKGGTRKRGKRRGRG